MKIFFLQPLCLHFVVWLHHQWNSRDQGAGFRGDVHGDQPLKVCWKLQKREFGNVSFRGFDSLISNSCPKLTRYSKMLAVLLVSSRRGVHQIVQQ